MDLAGPDVRESFWGESCHSRYPPCAQSESKSNWWKTSPSVLKDPELHTAQALKYYSYSFGYKNMVQEHPWLVSQCSPDRLPVSSFTCIRCSASVISTQRIFVHLSFSSSGDPAVWRLDYHTWILRDHRRAAAAGSKTNTADKHILHPKPAGFGLLLPGKNGGEEILAILHCEVSWLTQPCHYKVNTHAPCTLC